MHSFWSIALLAWASRTPARASDPCAAAAGGTFNAYAVVTPVPRSDTLAVVTICLVADTSRLRIGGYHGELSLPRSSRVIAVDRPTGGTRIENTTVAGRVSFAGVAADGIRSGAVLGLTIARRRARDDEQLRLTMIDVTDSNGREVRPQFAVDSMPRFLQKH